MSFFNNLLPTYRQKNLALAGATALMLLLVYFLSIQRTIGTYQAYKSKKAAVEQARSAPQEIAQLQTRVDALRQTGLKPYDREYLLAQLTGFCRKNNLLVRTFPQAERVVENKYPVLSNTIEVEGNFKQLVQLVHLMEQQERLGSISSLKFFTEKNRLTKKTFLRLQIILRNLEP